MGIGDKFLDVRDGMLGKMITKAADKMERVNEDLEKEGSKVRIAAFEVEMGTPPSVVFSVEKADTDPAA